MNLGSRGRSLAEAMTDMMPINVQRNLYVASSSAAELIMG